MLQKYNIKKKENVYISISYFRIKEENRHEGSSIQPSTNVISKGRKKGDYRSQQCKVEWCGCEIKARNKNLLSFIQDISWKFLYFPKLTQTNFTNTVK